MADIPTCLEELGKHYRGLPPAVPQPKGLRPPLACNMATLAIHGMATDHDTIAPSGPKRPELRPVALNSRLSAFTAVSPWAAWRMSQRISTQQAKAICSSTCSSIPRWHWLNCCMLKLYACFSHYHHVFRMKQLSFWNHPSARQPC